MSSLLRVMLCQFFGERTGVVGKPRIYKIIASAQSRARLSFCRVQQNRCKQEFCYFTAPTIVMYSSVIQRYLYCWIFETCQITCGLRVSTLSTLLCLVSLRPGPIRVQLEIEAKAQETVQVVRAGEANCANARPCLRQCEVDR